MAISQASVDATTAPGYHQIAPNLYLQIRPHGSRSWLFRYQRGGRAHWIGIGPSAAVPLAKALKAALRYRLALAEGRDPLTEKRAGRTARTVTFADALDAFLVDQSAVWSDQTRLVLRRCMANHALPVIGNLDAAAIDTEHIVAILRKLTNRPATAERIRGLLRRVLAYAVAIGARKLPNPASPDALAHRLPVQRRAVTHRAAPDVAELPAIYRELAGVETRAAQALRFCILTASRPGEVQLARWAEIDTERTLWTVPASRMKTRRVHRIPLSRQAVALLGTPGDPGALIFPGHRRGRPLSDVALLLTLRRVRAELTVHGTARAGFRSWASETGQNDEAAELALAHVVRGVRAAYQRSDLLELRRELMQAWGTFLAGMSPGEWLMAMQRASSK